MLSGITISKCMLLFSIVQLKTEGLARHNLKKQSQYFSYIFPQFPDRSANHSCDSEQCPMCVFDQVPATLSSLFLYDISSNLFTRNCHG